MSNNGQAAQHCFFEQITYIFCRINGIHLSVPNQGALDSRSQGCIKEGNKEFMEVGKLKTLGGRILHEEAKAILDSINHDRFILEEE